MTAPWPEDVTAVVLSYGDGPVASCVESLRSAGATDTQVLVVHNPSAAQEACPGVPGLPLVINRPVNDGYGPAMNDGIELARQRGARFALMCTHDASVGAAVPLLRAAMDDPSIGLCGPALTDGQAVFTTGGALRRGRAWHHLETSGGLVDADWLDGSVLLLRLDPPVSLPVDYFLYWEDVELAERVRAAGGRVVCVRQAAATSVPGNIGARSSLYAFLRWRNASLAARRRRAWGELGWTLLRGVATAFSHDRTAILRGLRHGVAGRGGLPPEDLMTSAAIPRLAE